MDSVWGFTDDTPIRLVYMISRSSRPPTTRMFGSILTYGKHSMSNWETRKYTLCRIFTSVRCLIPGVSSDLLFWMRSEWSFRIIFWSILDLLCVLNLQFKTVQFLRKVSRLDCFLILFRCVKVHIGCCGLFCFLSCRKSPSTVDIRDVVYILLVIFWNF